MNGKYFLWWSGRTLPYVAVYLVLAAGFVTLCLGTPEPSALSSWLFSFSIILPSGIYAAVLSLHTFWYRYSRRSADFHLALRGNLHSVRWTRVLVGYLAFLLPLALVFWFALLLAYARGASISGAFSPFAFLVFLLIESAIFFLTAFPFSRAHHVVEAVIDYLVFHGVLAVGLMPLALLITLPLGRLGVMTDVLGEILEASLIHTGYLGFPASAGNAVFADLVAPLLFLEEAGSFFAGHGVLVKIDVLLCLTLSVLALAGILFLKEPGGERFGAAPEGMSLERVLVHVAIGESLFWLFLVEGLAILSMARADSGGFTFLALPLLAGVTIMVLGGSYILLAMFNRSFRLSKKDVRLLPIPGAMALLGLLLSFFVL